MSETPNSRPSILLEADKAVNGDRQDDYGHPKINHTRTAEMWSSFLGVKITPEQVCMMNILQKVSRSSHMITRDGLVDIAGYALNVEMIQNEENP